MSKLPVPVAHLAIVHPLAVSLTHARCCSSRTLNAEAAVWEWVRIVSFVN